MITLFMIRHAESEANANRIIASQLPFPLSSDGKAEANAIASELKALTSIDRIISSPLRRAMETAEPFHRGYGIAIEEDPRIAEQHMGDFSGMTYDEVKVIPDYVTDSKARWNWIPRGGGESYKMMADRVRGFFESLDVTDSRKRVLVVTHAITFRLIRGLLENTLPEYPKEFPNNGEIWKVEYRGLGPRYSIESIFLGNSKDYTHNP